MAHLKENWKKPGMGQNLLSFVCAAFMLCAVPLLFRNAFFDINRFKVEMVCRVVPVLALLAVVVRFLDGERVACPRSARLCGGIMALFLCLCIVSCAFAGFEQATLDGSEGRYCGLIFMLCCGAAFFLIAMGRYNRYLLVPAVLTAAAIALLGFANAMGVDPLHFYARIKKGQEPVFLSTIGNFDFYGTYLAVLFPLAGAQFVFAKGNGMRAFGLLSAAVIAFGAMASRTDSAFVGLHLACFALLSLSGGDFARMARAFGLWAMTFASLPCTFSILEYSAFTPEFTGLTKLLFRLRAGEMIALVLLVLCVLCAAARARGMRAPGKRRTMIAFLSLLIIFLLIVLAVVVWFSVFDVETDLGGAEDFFRFNDQWGTLRGAAYLRSLRAFSDYTLRQKLFGVGMELTLRVLHPYFDDPALLIYGVFNDPHCQLLQMLLTCGLFGMLAFGALYVCMLATLFRHAGESPLRCGAAASVLAYLIVLLINVTQPILIATYFSVCALGLSALRDAQEGGAYES